MSQQISATSERFYFYCFVPFRSKNISTIKVEMALKKSSEVFFPNDKRENALAKTEHLTFIDMQKNIIYLGIHTLSSGKPRLAFHTQCPRENYWTLSHDLKST